MVKLGALLQNTTTLGKNENKQTGIEYTEVLKDGIYKSYNNGAMSVIKKVQNLPDGVITGQVDDTQEESFQLHQKVPFNIYLRILKFYAEVTEKDGTEASVLIYKNVKNKELPKELKEEYGEAFKEIEGTDFVLLVPNQENTGSRSSFVIDGLKDKAFSWCEEHLIGVAETHSHNTMDAFWSGVDDYYERHNKLRMYMVMGHLGKHQQKTKQYEVRYCYNKEFTEGLSINELFEVPEFKEVKTTTQEIHYDSNIDLGLTNKKEEDDVNILEFPTVLKQINTFELPLETPEDWWNRLKQPKPPFVNKRIPFLRDTEDADLITSSINTDHNIKTALHSSVAENYPTEITDLKHEENSTEVENDKEYIEKLKKLGRDFAYSRTEWIEILIEIYYYIQESSINNTKPRTDHYFISVYVAEILYQKALEKGLIEYIQSEEDEKVIKKSFIDHIEDLIYQNLTEYPTTEQYLDQIVRKLEQVAEGFSYEIGYNSQEELEDKLISKLCTYYMDYDLAEQLTDYVINIS